MLAEAGGIAADRTGPEVGGACRCWAAPRGGWAYIRKVNRVSITLEDNWGGIGVPMRGSRRTNFVGVKRNRRPCRGGVRQQERENKNTETAPPVPRQHFQRRISNMGHYELSLSVGFVAIVILNLIPGHGTVRR